MKERGEENARGSGSEKVCVCVCTAVDLIVLHTQVLLSANRLLKESPACRGKNATDAMGDKAGKYQCYLGFLREGLWREVRPKLPAILFQGVGSASDVAAAAAAAAEAAVAAAAAAGEKNYIYIYIYIGCSGSGSSCR